MESATLLPPTRLRHKGRKSQAAKYKAPDPLQDNGVIKKRIQEVGRLNAFDQKAATVFGKLNLDGKIENNHYEAAHKLSRLYSAMNTCIMSPTSKTASYGGSSGIALVDQDEVERRCQETMRRYASAQDEIRQECGSDTWFVVKRVVCEEKEITEFKNQISALAELKNGLQALCDLWKM